MAQPGYATIIYKKNAYAGPKLIESGTATGGTTAEITLAASAVHADQTYYNGMSILITAGTNAGLCFPIAAAGNNWDNTTKVLTIEGTAPVAFDATSAYSIVKMVTETAVPQDYGTMEELFDLYHSMGSLANLVMIWTGRGWSSISSMTKTSSAKPVAMLSTSSGAIFHGNIAAATDGPISIPASKVLGGSTLKDAASGVSVDVGFSCIAEPTLSDDSSRRTYLKTSGTLSSSSTAQNLPDAILYRIGLADSIDKMYWSCGLYMKADL
jgi:hypothetical protein